jgi:hypothetical protein
MSFVTLKGRPMTQPPDIFLYLRLLCHFECIVNFNAKVSASAFQVCMTEQ